MIAPSNTNIERSHTSERQVSDLGIGTMTLLLLLVIMSLLLWVETISLPGRIFLRYLSLIPVILVAYQLGMVEGQIMAGFFSFAFLPELSKTLLGNGSALLASGNLIYMVIIHLTAYITANYSRTLKMRQSLGDLTREWRTLLSRGMDVEQVIHFLITRAQEICNATYGLVLYRHPLESQWQVVTLQTNETLPVYGPFEEDVLGLAEWMITQTSDKNSRPVFLDRLDQRSHFFLANEQPDDQNPDRLTSLLSYPLTNRDGTQMGVLCLINLSLGYFESPDMQNLADLVLGGEKALEYAGVYARTDYALAKRVRQLGSIQRTARDLNQTLDAEAIARLTLECALEITDAEAGVISIQVKGFPPVVFSIGERTTPQAEFPLGESDFGHVTDQLEQSQVSSRLLAPIHRDQQNFGLVIVESASPKIFKEASRHVLMILTDHAANALDNLRLFSEVQAQQERGSLIIRSIEDGLITVDLSGMTLTLNPAAENLTGWSADQAVGQLICKVLSSHHSSDQDDCPLLGAIQKQQLYVQERYLLTTPSGIGRVLSIKISPLPASEGFGSSALVVLHDITRQDEIDRGQRELIAAISHELRAPLTVISAITETMLAESSDSAKRSGGTMAGEDRAYDRYLHSLIEQTRRLAGFSDRILDVYRVETGLLRVQLRPLPVGLFVEQIVNQWRASMSTPTSPKHPIEIHAPERSPWVNADEKGFESILNNLLDNAIKYTPPDSTIRVIINPPDNGFVTCSVEDEGPGIEPIHQSQIFKRFYRVDGRDSQRVYGHGLGLYIAQSLVEAMHGKIWVTSQPGKGSCFQFALPVIEDQP